MLIQHLPVKRTFRTYYLTGLLYLLICSYNQCVSIHYPTAHAIQDTMQPVSQKLHDPHFISKKTKAQRGCELAKPPSKKWIQKNHIILFQLVCYFKYITLQIIINIFSTNKYPYHQQFSHSQHFLSCLSERNSQVNFCS